MPPRTKREDQLQRPRSRKGADQQAVRRGLMRPVLMPEPDEDWTPVVAMVWNSLAESGQADFYQQSDWAYAWLTCSELDVYLRATYRESGDAKRSPEMFKALLSALDNLLLTEGARRRLRVELEQPKPDQGDPQLAVVTSLMERIGGDTEDDEDDE